MFEQSTTRINNDTGKFSHRMAGHVLQCVSLSQPKSRVYRMETRFVRTEIQGPFVDDNNVCGKVYCSCYGFRPVKEVQMKNNKNNNKITLNWLKFIQ